MCCLSSESLFTEVQVLSLYGIPSLAINGNMSFEQRDQRIRDLYDDDNDARVLIFSSVGSAGLNLAIADVVVFFVSVLYTIGIQFLIHII